MGSHSKVMVVLLALLPSEEEISPMRTLRRVASWITGAVVVVFFGVESVMLTAVF